MDRAKGVRTHPPGEVTGLLRKWSHGDREALDELIPLVYAELRRLSRYYLSRERPNHTLQTIDLINEAFVRLIDPGEVSWQDRAHFFGIAATTMRRILVDRARRRHRQKRGGGRKTVPFDESMTVVHPRKDRELLALDDALTTLSDFDPGLGRLVELRFFGGLSIQETAEVLEISPASVKRGWTTAKLWLRREVTGI
jgi:RNA polymerase sigma factor (TIGR02999 family)